MTRRWASVMVILTVGLAGCSSSGGTPQPSATPPPTASPSGTTTPTPATSTVTVTLTAPTTSGDTVTPSPVSGTTTASNTVQRCPTSSLRMARGSDEGAGGTQYVTITLTNTSRSTCTLYGYPGVSVIDSSGNTVQYPAKRGHTGTESVPGPRTVTLAPGRPGYFLVTSINVIPNPECTHAFHGERLRVYPPDSTRTLTIAFTQPFCDLGVGPVTATAN